AWNHSSTSLAMTSTHRFIRVLAACACIASTACGDRNDAAETQVDSTAVSNGGTVPDSLSQATPDSLDVAMPGTGSPSSGAAPGGGSAPRSGGAPVGGASGGSAQNSGGDDGASILTRAASKYASVRSMRADFTMVTQNPLLRSTTTSHGRIYQQRPDRIALRFTDPAGDVILSDGTYFWVYTPSTTKGQVLRSPASAAGTSAVDLQAQFLGDPVKRFTHTMQPAESVDGRMADVLTLVPRGNEPFRSLKVWIDRSDSMARRFEVTERNGVVRRMELDNLQVNGTIPADVFRFDVPAGVRVLEQ
ncbi:MAG TPA: outer-membrane lipoprotein carrier protein LolA, partial [Longimicrobiales bacterium]